MIKVSKYQGLGNDFIICLDKDAKCKSNSDYSHLAIKLCNNEILGSTDGLICVKTNPLEMVFYNKDGSIGTMCGNGLRCFIKYCWDNSIINDSFNVVKTKAGLYETYIESVEPFIVKAKMGLPNYDNQILKIKTAEKNFINQKVMFNNKDYYLTSMFMGTHHTVIFVEKLKELTEELGYFMCHLDIFDDRTNVDFVEFVNKNELKVKTYERGVGYTLACGTGACASFCAARLFKMCEENVVVHFENGDLIISEIHDNIYMTGPCEKIFTKELNRN